MCVLFCLFFFNLLRAYLLVFCLFLLLFSLNLGEFTLIQILLLIHLSTRRDRVSHDNPPDEDNVLGQQRHERKGHGRPRQRVPHAAPNAVLINHLDEAVHGAQREERARGQGADEHAPVAGQEGVPGAEEVQLHGGEEEELDAEEDVAGQGEAAADLGAGGRDAAAGREEDDGADKGDAQRLGESVVFGVGGVVIVEAVALALSVFISCRGRSSNFFSKKNILPEVVQRHTLDG